MAKRKYKAHPHAPFTDEQAEWIGEQLEAGGGQTTPHELVELARPKSSRGHVLFVWDDAKAGEAFRVDQARSHLRMVQITVVSGGEAQTVRACFPVFMVDEEEGARRSHVSYDRVKKNPDLAQQVLGKATHEIKAWRRRYALYQRVFGQVFKAVDKLED